jgi:hypothetical protein
MKVNTKTRAKHARTAFFVVMLSAAAATAGATTLLRMSLAQISQTAQVIVRARCEGNFTAWDAGEIWTFTTFQVEEVWRGSLPVPQIRVRLLGGRAGNLTSNVSGVPRFRAGEDVVLFLEKTPRGDFSVVSWEQGTFRIRRGAAPGPENVTQDTASFATFDPATRRFAAEGIRNVPLEAFHARVDAALRASSGSGKP